MEQGGCKSLTRSVLCFRLFPTCPLTGESRLFLETLFTPLGRRLVVSSAPSLGYGAKENLWNSPPCHSGIQGSKVTLLSLQLSRLFIIFSR